MGPQPYQPNLNKDEQAEQKLPKYVTLIGENCYKIDLDKLSEIDPSGSEAFPCPKCGNPIDPKDKTEKNYIILPIVGTDVDTGIRLDLKCKCGSVLEVTGSFPKK